MYLWAELTFFELTKIELERLSSRNLRYHHDVQTYEVWSLVSFQGHIWLLVSFRFLEAFGPESYDNRILQALEISRYIHNFLKSKKLGSFQEIYYSNLKVT